MLKDFFDGENIEYYKVLSVSDVKIWDEKKFLRAEEEIGTIQSVCVFLIPYYFGQRTTNLSVYAQVKDYHLYIKELSARFGAYLEEKKSDLLFRGFADSSPLAERDAALGAGLCVLGKNGLCINEKYGSYFFIGAFFLNRDLSCEKRSETMECKKCGLCEKACPTGAIFDKERKKCLSLLSQKKELTEEEKSLVDQAECKWGCDLCQSICPMNQNAEKTPILFFQTDHISTLSKEVIDLPKKAFSDRAFSWRGRKILRRNLGLDNEKKDES